MTFGASGLGQGFGFGIAINLYDMFTGPAYRIQRSMRALQLSTSGFAKTMERDIRSVKAQFALLAGSAGIAALAAAPVMVAAEFDALTAQFEVMLGSAQQAKKVLLDLRSFAKETPFNTKETVLAAKQLLAFGIAQKDLMKDMKMLGDISSAVGKENLEPIILAFGQARTKGFLMGDELRQFAERGVPVLDYIGKMLGTTDGEQIFKAITNRQVTFDMLREAFRQMTSDGGRFANMMLKLEGRPMQILDRIGGELYEIQLKFGEALMNSAKPIIQVAAALVSIVNDLSPTWIGSLAANFALLAGSIATLATSMYLLKKGPTLGRYLAGSYAQAMGYRQAALNIMNENSVTGGIMRHVKALSVLQARKSQGKWGGLKDSPAARLYKALFPIREEMSAEMVIPGDDPVQKLLMAFKQGKLSYTDSPALHGWEKKGGKWRNMTGMPIPLSGKHKIGANASLSHSTLMGMMSKYPHKFAPDMESAVLKNAANMAIPPVIVPGTLVQRRGLIKLNEVGMRLGKTFRSLGMTMGAPYRAANRVARGAALLTNMYTKQIFQIGGLIVVFGVLLKGYMHFQRILKGTEKPAEGFIGLLQKIGGAMTGVYELVSSWNGERSIMNMDIANALSRLGILNRVAKLSVFFIRLKEMFHGFANVFLLLFDAITWAMGAIGYGVALILNLVSKLIGYSSELSIDVRVWRAFGAVIGVYLVGSLILATANFVAMTYQAIIAAAATALAWAPVVLPFLAITAALVGILWLMNKITGLDMDLPFSQFLSGNDPSAASAYGMTDAVTSDNMFTASVATQERIRRSREAQRESSLAAYNKAAGVGVTKQTINLQLDGKTVSTVVNDVNRIELAR